MELVLARLNGEERWRSLAPPDRLAIREHMRPVFEAAVAVGWSPPASGVRS
jgi:hypothetical protein